MKAQSLIDVLQGMLDGKTIQLITHNGKWIDMVRSTHFIIAECVVDEIELRVKPEPREFNVRMSGGLYVECLNGSLEHGETIKVIEVLD